MKFVLWKQWDQIRNQQQKKIWKIPKYLEIRQYLSKPWIKGNFKNLELNENENTKMYGLQLKQFLVEFIGLSTYIRYKSNKNTKSVSTSRSQKTKGKSNMKQRKE